MAKGFTLFLLLLVLPALCAADMEGHTSQWDSSITDNSSVDGDTAREPPPPPGLFVQVEADTTDNAQESGSAGSPHSFTSLPLIQLLSILACLYPVYMIGLPSDNSHPVEASEPESPTQSLRALCKARAPASDSDVGLSLGGLSDLQCDLQGALDDGVPKKRKRRRRRRVFGEDDTGEGGARQLRQSVASTRTFTPPPGIYFHNGTLVDPSTFLILAGVRNKSEWMRSETEVAMASGLHDSAMACDGSANEGTVIPPITVPVPVAPATAVAVAAAAIVAVAAANGADPALPRKSQPRLSAAAKAFVPIPA